MLPDERACFFPRAGAQFLFWCGRFSHGAIIPLMKRQFLLAAVVCCLSVMVIVHAQQPVADRRAAERAIMKADRDLSRFLSFVAEDAAFDANRGREAVGNLHTDSI